MQVTAPELKTVIHITFQDFARSDGKAENCKYLLETEIHRKDCEQKQPEMCHQECYATSFEIV